MKIVTAHTVYEVTRKPDGSGFHVEVIEGKNKGATRDGETISGLKMGANFILSSNGQEIIKSTTVQSASGSL
jgi:hypothetical protein